MSSRTVPLSSFMETFEHEMSLLSAMAFLCLPFCLVYLAVSSASYSSLSTNKCLSRSRVLAATCLLLVAIEYPFSLWLRGGDDSGLADLIKGPDPRLNEILERTPLLQQGPKPPPLFRNRHIQFIPWLIQNEIHRRQGIAYQRIHVHVSDCIDKTSSMTATTTEDELEHGPTCPLSQQSMNDTITLDVFPPFDDEDADPTTSVLAQGFNRSSPIIIFSPGLRCHSQDLPGTMIVRRAFEQGFRSVVFHRRGHTPDQTLSSPRWNLFGDVDDLEQIYWHVKNILVAPNTPIFLHGISSGTAVAVTALAKWDRRRRDEPHRPTPSFVASIAVTPGYDISKVLSRERFLFPYNDILLGGVKDQFIRRNEALLRSHNTAAVDQALAANSLQEFVDAAVPFAGYENTTLYYSQTNPINNVRDISTPTLILNAVDDPCCKISNLYEQSPYPHHSNHTFAEMIAATQNALVAVTHTGSHCPFLSTPSSSEKPNVWFPLVRDPLAMARPAEAGGVGWSFGWMLNSWADEVSIQYYLATLEVYGERRFF